MRNDVYVRTLARAIELLGSERALAERLSVPEERVRFWLAGSVPVPYGVFVTLVDLLLELGMTELKSAELRRQ